MCRSLLALILCLIAPQLAIADTLDQVIVKKTPGILQTLKDKRISNVGVLKFLSAQGAGGTTDVGEINTSIADRVEMALILCGDIKDHVGVIRNASAVAAKIKGANHTTPEGRKALFAAKYPLAWGTEDVLADAFLTGVVRVQADHSLRVSIYLVVPEGKTEQLLTFTASPDVASLIEIGGSFRTRGLFEDGTFENDASKAKVRLETVRKDAADSADKVRQEPAKNHPANPIANPEVVVTVLYDGVRQIIEFGNGEARIPEPRTGQKVKFVIERKNDTIAGLLALVLKVNGENTIEQQRFRDLECRKWILDKGNRYEISGFLLVGNQKSSPFKVLSPAESKATEFRYGPEVGTISWSVFRSFQVEKKDEIVEVKTYDDLDANALNRGLFPAKSPDSLANLRKGFDKSGDDHSRGLIAEDKSNVIDTPTRRVTFQADPVPIIHATIRYYKK